MKTNQPGEVILRTEGLTREIENLYIVDQVSVAIRQGEVWAVVGPSGAGKSSFLRLLNRLDEPQQGHIWFHGQDIKSIPPQELRRRIALVLQEANLFPGTVEMNLQFGPHQRGECLSEGEIEDLLIRVGLPTFKTREVQTLSVGEAQRVSLARTLANSPEILLLDEPTASLDDRAKQEIEELVISIVREQGITCLMVTHDKQQAVRIATHAMLLEKGRLVRWGPAAEVAHA